MLKCLQSQCHTAQFGSALHHTIARCSDYFSSLSNVIPPLIRHQGLRKRARSYSVQMSARPQASVRPVTAMASGSRARSVQRRSVITSTTTDWIQPSQSTTYISSRTPHQLLSRGTSRGMLIPISKATRIHTSPTVLLIPISTVSFSKIALLTEFDDLGYNESVASNATSGSTSMASSSFQSLALSGFFLNHTGARTPRRTLHSATGTGHPARECEGYNGTLGDSSLAGTGPLQSPSPGSAIGTIFKNIGSCSSATILQPLIPTGPSSGNHSSRSNASAMSMHPMTALPSIGLLPPYYNATVLHNSHSGGGTRIISSNLN